MARDTISIATFVLAMKLRINCCPNKSQPPHRWFVRRLPELHQIVVGRSQSNSQQQSLGRLQHPTRYSRLRSTSQHNLTHHGSSLNWIKYFVAQDPGYDINHMTFSQFDQIFNKSSLPLPMSLESRTQISPRSKLTVERSLHGMVSQTHSSPLNLQFSTVQH